MKKDNNEVEEDQHNAKKKKGKNFSINYLRNI